MNTALNIHANWLEAEWGDPVERATYADLLIQVGEHCATRIEDTEDGLVHDRIRVSAFDLAAWLGINWWRLLWEPERKDSLSWQMSHRMGAVGGGYEWPGMCFSCDGEVVHIRSTIGNEQEHTLARYLDAFSQLVVTKEFERAVASFIGSVIERLDSSKVNDRRLAELWEQVCDERTDPEQAARCKMEAMLGFDPDEAPEDLINKLQEKQSAYGRAAVEEIVAASAVEAPNDLDILWNRTRSHGFDMEIQGLANIRDQWRKVSDRLDRTILPWERATQAAAVVRDSWDIQPGMLETDVLLNRLSVSDEALESAGGSGQLNVSAGLRNGDDAHLKAFFHVKHPKSQRFMLARLVGDHLDTSGLDEKLLPSTKARTARQKFQRAFAQELLCPYEDLKNFFDEEHIQYGDIDDEDIETAAEHFDVSTMVVQTALVNKGMLERDVLPT